MQRLTNDPAIAGTNVRGILAMLLAMACLIVNDTLIKLASTSLPTGEIIFLRGLVATTLMILITMASRGAGNMRALLSGAVLLRAAAESLAAITFITALFHMPIALVTGILQLSPLAVTAASALILKEHVGWRRWSAALVGLVGVLLIIQPGTSGFTGWSALALLTVLLVTVRDIATRRIPAHVSTLAAATLTSFGVTLAGGIQMHLEHWVPPTLPVFALLVAAAIFVILAYIAMIVALRSGEVSVVAPFRYSIVVWALIAGIIVWREFPNLVALAGVVIVVAAGIYSVRREQRTRTKAADSP